MPTKIKILIGILIVVIILAGGWWVWNTQIENRCNSDNDCIYDCSCGCISNQNIVCPLFEPRMGCEQYLCSACRCLNGRCASWDEVFQEAQKTKNIELCHEIKDVSCKDYCLGVLENLLKKEEVTITTDKTEYEQGETVKIIIRNDLDKEKLIHLPFYTIEKSDNGSWVEIKRVDCPCEVACKIAAYFILQPHGVKEYQWDQKETWCSDPTKISQTISNQIPFGKYRIKSEISDIDDYKSKYTIYSNEFTIR